MIYRISHRTTYKYAYAVSVGNHVACLTPRSYSNNQVILSSLKITPTPITQTERIDYFGNRLSFFMVDEPHKELIVEATSEVKRKSDVDADVERSPAWEESTAALADDHTPEGLDAYQYQFESPRIRIRPEFARYALESFMTSRPMREALMELTARINSDFKFDSSVTTVRTPIEEVFKKRRGVCQDFAHFQIACLRSINIAARYVSGYLRTYPQPGKARLIGSDASHAWLSAYCRGLGWMDMDPTNNLAPTEGHVTLAWGRDYGDVSPLRGLILGGGNHVLKVEVDMAPVEAL